MKYQQEEAKPPTIGEKKTLTSSKVKKLRLKRRKKRSAASSNADFFDLPPIILVLTGIAFLLYAYGFINSIVLLPSLDASVDKVARLAQIIEAMEGRANVKNTESGANHVPAHKIMKEEFTKKQKKTINSSSKELELPESHWPVSIRYEDSNFDEIIHPGDKQTVMSVPKFWSPPLTDGSLMSRDLATRFGSYTDGHVDTDYRNKGNPDLRTIYVAIASYRDWQCRYTVESLFTTAKFPERVRVVVVDQIVEGDPSCGVPLQPCDKDPEQGLCKYTDQIDVMEVDAQLSIGPVFARHIGHRLYRGEYYAMQIDAHVTFVKDWDTDIIQQMEATRNEMAVMSFYLTDIQGSIDPITGKSKRNTVPIMCNTDYEGGQAEHLRHGSQPEGPPVIRDMPQMQPYWAAGWSFSRGHFVTNIPYDLYQPMIFMGEESSIGIRGFTYGYDHYTAQRSICFHTYANGANAAKRNKVHHFWDNNRLYSGTGVKAMKRLLGIIGMNPEVDPAEWDHTDEKLYGIGTERKLSQFYETFGIDVVHKKVEANLCRFVRTGKMHKQFLPYLRKNGMGIDYSKIDYKFVNPEKKK